MGSRIKAEPVVFWGLLEGVGIAVLGLLALFEVVTLTEAQTGGVLLAIAAVGAVFAFLVRGQVTPIADPRDKAGNLLVPLVHAVEKALAADPADPPTGEGF